MSYVEVAKNYVEGLGGIDNILFIDNCVTRLRVEVADMKKVNNDRLIELGSKGTVYVGQNQFQLIIGSCVVLIADEMHVLKGDGVISAQTGEDYTEIAQAYIDALGGASNLDVIDNCITRLRLTLKDGGKANEDALSKLDNKGVFYKSENEIHIVIGLVVTSIAETMRNLCKK